MPSNQFNTFELGDVVVPIHSAFTLSQNYATLGGYTTLRMLDGAAVKQTNWQKMSVATSGTGTIPHGLEMLDYTQQLVMKCAAVRGVVSSSNAMAIPAERRTDVPFQARGYAYLDADGKNRGEWVDTVITDLTGNIATLQSVANATQYRVIYYPEIIVFCDPPSQDTDVHGAAVSWSLQAEQV